LLQITDRAKKKLAAYLTEEAADSAMVRLYIRGMG